MKPTASARLPERAKLASAIERHGEAAGQLARIDAAIQKISDSRIEDCVAIGRAREALKIAAAGRSEILISKTLGEPPPDLPSPDEAKATLDAAEASLDASTSALRVLDGEKRQAELALYLAERALQGAVKEAVAADPALALLHGEFERTRLRMSTLIGALLGAGVTVSRVAWEENAFIADPAWVNAIARLREDPDAGLPSPPPDEPPDAGTRDGRKRAA